MLTKFKNVTIITSEDSAVKGISFELVDTGSKGVIKARKKRNNPPKTVLLIKVKSKRLLFTPDSAAADLEEYFSQIQLCANTIAKLQTGRVE